MAKISTRSFVDLLVQVGIILALVAVLFLGFFFVYLPFSTNHGQTITVPDLSKLSVDEMQDILGDRNLRYEVSDCTFVVGAQPLTVLGQYPRANAKVKEDRKIYVTVTRRVAPLVPMPDLVNMIDRSAKRMLDPTWPKTPCCGSFTTAGKLPPVRPFRKDRRLTWRSATVWVIRCLPFPTL